MSIASQPAKRPLRILIVGDDVSFPHGQGAAMRLAAVAKGLQEAGADVRILVTSVTERDRATAVNTASRGTHDGIAFEYTTGTPIRPQSFWGRRWVQLRGVCLAMWRVADPRRAPCDAVLITTMHSLMLPIAVGWLGKLRGAVLLYDGCELPFVYDRHLLRRRLYGACYTRVVYRVYDGAYVISEYLEKRFARYLRPNARLIRMPALVDVERFSAAPSTPAADAPPYVAYTGSLYISKGVDDLLRAFALIAPAYPGLELWIAGDHRGTDAQRVEELSRVLGMSNRVRWLGLIPHARLPRVLAGARALLVPHRGGEQSLGAFPTKLAEYLASGRPVIVTRVGEIDRYVTDGTHAYLVPPDDPAALAARLRDVLDDPVAAAAVGRQGQEVARRHFDFRVHGRRLLADIRALSANGVHER